MNIMANKQHGVSLSGFLKVVVVLFVVAIVGMKVGPVYSQNTAIKNILDTIVHDPEIGDVRAARASFAKRALIADVKVISENDLVISNNDGKLTIEVTYFVKMPLVYNVSLYFDFNIVSSRNRVI